jgi:hypothetical protein
MALIGPGFTVFFTDQISTCSLHPQVSWASNKPLYVWENREKTQEELNKGRSQTHHFTRWTLHTLLARHTNNTLQRKDQHHEEQILVKIQEAPPPDQGAA